MTRLRRLFALVPLVATLALAGCGGQTGLSVVVAVAPEYLAGVDFDSLTVYVTTESMGTLGPPAFPVTPETPKPYRVVFLKGEEDFRKVSVTAQLKLKGVSVKTATLPDVTFEDGELKEVSVEIRR